MDFISRYLSDLIKATKGGTLTTGTATTSTSGATFVQLASVPCNSVTFVNDTGTKISVKVKAGTAYIPVFNGSYFTFDGINSASDLFIKRTDESNTQVTITYTINS